MEELQTQITKLERTLSMNVEQGTEDMLSQRKALNSRREILEKAIKETEARASVASRIMADYERLKIARDRALKEFDDVGEKLKAVSNTSRVGEEPVKILEPATDAFLREKKLVQKLAVGVIGGFIVGLGILFLIDKMDDRVNTLTELTNAFDEEILGQIPELPLRHGEKHVPLLNPDDTRHSFAEAYRNVRSSLLFLDTEDFKPRTFVITSSIPSEGTSTLAANLSLTLANAGNRVLLIDADLRRGALSTLFGIKAEAGMSEMLAGKLDWPSAVLPTAHPHLCILPRGRSTNKAGELFLTSRMDDLLREAPQKFDYIFIDSAPILATDDTPTFAPKIDGVLFVVRASFVGARAAKTAIGQLRKRGATVLGLVFNRISETMPDYQYYKYSEYYATKEND
jgi:capsular exopolysaccharide synthesis family protein